GRDAWRRTDLAASRAHGAPVPQRPPGLCAHLVCPGRYHGRRHRLPVAGRPARAPRGGSFAALLTHDPHSPQAVAEAAVAPERLAHRRNLLHLVELPWLAVAGQLLTILLVQ